MASKINKIFTVTLSLVVSLFISSCKKEQLDSLNIVFNIKSEENLTDVFYTANGETLKFTLDLDRNASTVGLTMKQIEVFLNNIKIAEAYDSEHLNVSCQLKKKTQGKNPLRITFKATAPGYRETIVHLNSVVYILPQKPIYGFNLHTADIWTEGSYVDFSISEISDATLHLNVTSVSYLVDENVVTHATTSDGIATYQVSNLSSGKHTLSAVVNCSIPEDNFSTQIIINKTITINK